MSRNDTVRMTIPTVAEAGSREAPMPLAFLSEEEEMGMRIEASIRPTKLFIGGISRHTTTKQLRDHFSAFGRVLDCVAMRQPDGRPRGFGYVTLDSTAAAERCLREPQCIDNRIVDLKPAVPEGSASGNTSPKEASFNMSMFGEQSYGAWHDTGLYGGGMPWWGHQDPLEKMTNQQSQGLDCLDILSATREQVMSSHGLPLQSFTAPEHDQLDETGFLVSPHMTDLAAMYTSSESRWSPKGASATLSASAPEFVPLGTQALADVKQCTPAKSSFLATGATPPSNARKASSRSRAPLGELTNIVEVDDLLKPFKSPSNKTADIGHGHLSAPKSNADDASPSSPAAETPDTAGVCKLQRPTDLDLDDKASNNELSPNDSSTAASLLSPPPPSIEIDEGRQEEERDAYASDDDDESDEDTGSSEESVIVDMECLPSAGSALHGTGECKRCNFFPKGRCQNGKDCSFCHYPHDKRKPSRQEKRERRAAWLEAHGMALEPEDLFENDEEANQQKPHQALQLPTHSAAFLSNQGKFVVYQDDDVCSDEIMAYSIFPGLPPIRATKLPAPLALPGTMDTGPALPPGLAIPQLSVRPWQPEAEASPVAMLTTSPQMPGHFDPHALQKVVSSTPLTSAPLSTAPSPVATPTAAACAQAHNLPATMCTVATQTNEDYMCQDCEEDVKAEDRAEHQWSRDELLRLRSGSVVTQAGEVSKLHSMKTFAIPGI